MTTLTLAKPLLTVDRRPIKTAPPLSISGRIFATLENAWFQRVVGMLAVLFSIVDGRYLAVLSLLIILSIHRSKSLVGLERREQALIYGAVFFLSVAILWVAGNQWNRSRDNSPVINAIADAAGAKIAAAIGKLTPNRGMTAPPQVIPAKPKPEPSKPKGSPLCAEDQSRPYKCRTDDELVSLLAGEQSKLLSLAKDASDSLRETPISLKRTPEEERAIRADVHHYLAKQIRECCIHDLADLRDEAIKRIGLPRIDLKEEDYWGHLKFSLENTSVSLGLWPETVLEYVPYIIKMEQLLGSIKQP